MEKNKFKNKSDRLEEIVKTVSDYVKKKMSGEKTGHDWWHCFRVLNLAEKISKKEGGNLFTIKLAALLHDISDWKFNGGDLKANAAVSRKILKHFRVEEKIIKQVCQIVENISWKGAGAKNKIKTKEGMIVQDADRLDALGAIGIARIFAYGSARGNWEIFNPNLKPKLHRGFNHYKNSRTTSINHFYEKVIFLKDRLNTETARKIAGRRDRFVRQYLKEFFREWQEATF